LLHVGSSDVAAVKVSPGAPSLLVNDGPLVRGSDLQFRFLIDWWGIWCNIQLLVDVFEF
jgi:hypothetical protein